MVQVQTALVSAITAAFVTMFIEYLAKPRLEARKDRIVDGNRERRKMMAKLVALLNDAGQVGMLTRPGLAWFIGKSALKDVSDEVDELYPSLLQFNHLLGKRQRDVAAKYVLGSSGKVYVLNYLVFLHEATGILAMESRKQPRSDKLPMAPEIEAVWAALLEDFAATHTALGLSKYRPLSYFRVLRQLMARYDKVEHDLRISSSLPVDGPGEPNADMPQPVSPDLD